MTQAQVQASIAAAIADRDDRYRIGPGDVLDIRIFNRPQLSREAVRVDGRGTIRMPLIEEDIQAACKTEGELGHEIARLYLKYQRNPQVDVFVKEYQSQPVAVIGAVMTPGQFRLQRRVRLLELIAAAGGPADRAGRNINIVHAPTSNIVCEAPLANESNDPAFGLVAYNLTDTLNGEERANPYMRPGDIVTVPDADKIYVVGNVVKPSAIALKEPITVSRAIAMAGGKMPDTKSDKIRIIRQLPGSADKSEIMVDLRAIERHQAPDIALQANDIVDVPTNDRSRLIKSLLGSGVSTLTQLPLRIIP